MRTDNNRPHPLSAYADAVLGYANAVNNRIRIPFTYNIYIILYYI
jgi:hypothetical protein